jgi:hypothetical protein
MVADCFRLTAEQIEELRSDLKFKEYMKHVTEMWLSLGFPADEATFKQTRLGGRNAWLMKWYEIRCQSQKKICTEPTFTSESWTAWLER